MSDQQRKQGRIRGFVNRIKFRIANWLLGPFNLMIVSATDFRAIRYVQGQMAMFVERSGALPQRQKARQKLRQYLAAQKNAIDAATNLSENPIELDNLPPELEKLARILQESERQRPDGGKTSGTNLATTDYKRKMADDMRKAGDVLKSVLGNTDKSTT